MRSLITPLAQGSHRAVVWYILWLKAAQKGPWGIDSGEPGPQSHEEYGTDRRIDRYWDKGHKQGGEGGGVGARGGLQRRRRCRIVARRPDPGVLSIGVLCID